MNHYLNRTGRSLLFAFSCLLFCFFPPSFAQAQSLEIGLMAGASAYHGELVPAAYSEKYKLLRPAAGVFVRYSPVEWFGLRLGVTATRLHGSGDYNGVTVYSERGVELRTPLQEAALLVELAPVEWRLFGLNMRPFGATGLAVCRFEPRLLIDGEWLDMRPLGTEGQGLTGSPPRYRNTKITLPVTFGLRVALSERVLLGGEVNARLPGTDYLDDISGRTVNYPLLRAERGETLAQISNPAATELTDDYRRGNLGKDAYVFVGFTLHYRFSVGGGRPLGCPRF